MREERRAVLTNRPPYPPRSRGGRGEATDRALDVHLPGSREPVARNPVPPGGLRPFPCICEVLPWNPLRTAHGLGIPAASIVDLHFGGRFSDFFLPLVKVYGGGTILSWSKGTPCPGIFTSMDALGRGAFLWRENEQRPVITLGPCLPRLRSPCCRPRVRAVRREEVRSLPAWSLLPGLRGQ